MWTPKAPLMLNLRRWSWKALLSLQPCLLHIFAVCDGCCCSSKDDQSTVQWCGVIFRISWAFVNYSTPWHCALVVVRAAATAITHAEYVKQAWLQGEEGFPRPASPTCCFTRLLRQAALRCLAARHYGTRRRH